MSFTILFVVVKNWTKGGCTLSRGRQMAKRNTPENLRVVNSEQKGRPSWGIRFVLQQLVTAKTFAAFFGCYGADPNAAFDSKYGGRPRPIGGKRPSTGPRSDCMPRRNGKAVQQPSRASNRESNQQTAVRSARHAGRTDMSFPLIYRSIPLGAQPLCNATTESSQPARQLFLNIILLRA